MPVPLSAFVNPIRAAVKDILLKHLVKEAGSILDSAKAMSQHPHRPELSRNGMPRKRGKGKS